MIAPDHKDSGEASHSAGDNDSVDQCALLLSTLSTSLANLIGLAPKPALGRSATHHSFKLGQFEITLLGDGHPVMDFAHPGRVERTGAAYTYIPGGRGPCSGSST